MIELTFTVENEEAAFFLLTYARSKGIPVTKAKKDDEEVEVHEGGFLKEKPAARRVPVSKPSRVKQIINKHVLR